MHTPLRFCIALGLLLAIAPTANAKAILQGTVSFLNSGSRPAAGVKISAFGANDCYTTDAGIFRLEFPDKKPGDKVKIIVGSNDRDGLALELVNDKVLAQVRIPSNPEDDIVEIIVCKVGQRNDAALRYNGIIVKAINEAMEKRLREIDEKLGTAKIDAETITALQNEKEKLAEERDSALAKAEEQALYIASINLDKTSKLVKDAVLKVDSLQDIHGAIAVLDNEILYQAYLKASEKKKKAEGEIQQVVSGFEFKIKLLEPMYRFGEMAECYEKIAGIYEQEVYEKEKLANNLVNASFFRRKNGEYQKALDINLKVVSIRENYLPGNDLALAGSYNLLALTYGDLGDQQKALDFNLKALSIAEQSKPADNRALAETYNYLALSYGDLGDHHKALEFKIKAIAILEKALDPNHPDLATLYSNVVWNYDNLGDRNKALEFGMKALGIREKILASDHPQLALSYNNIATTYGTFGDYKKALEFNLKALSIWEKVLPPNHPDLAQSYNNIGWTYGNFGDTQKALEYNLKALAIRIKVLPEYHADLAASYSNSGVAYRNAGEYEKGIEFIQKAIQIGELSNPKHFYLNRFYANLGITYLKLRQYPEAKAALEKSENMKAEERVYRGWAMYYALQNDKTKAIENLQKAVSLGYKDLKWIETDDSLENIRSEQVYKEIVEQLKTGK